MPKTVTRSGRRLMDVEDCCTCGVIFAVDRSYLDARKTDLATFYCPNGHGMSYTQSEADRLRAALTAARDQLAAANRRNVNLQEKSHRAARPLALASPQRPQDCRLCARR